MAWSHSAPLGCAQQAMEGAGVRDNDPGYWRECWDAERQEFVRSERVGTQLQTVLQSLQQRCNDLQAENDRIKAEVRPDASSECLQSEVEAALQARQALEMRQSVLSVEIQRHRAECEARVAQSAAHVKNLEESVVVREAIEEACRDAESRRDRAVLESKSMVMVETLRHAAEESTRLTSQLRVQEAETAELREALADSWASRAEPAAPSVEKPIDSAAALQALTDMQEELQWLAKMQQEASAEVHHVQKLERTEVALQSQLRSVMEENATLRSTRMDLGDAGRTMREAIASQSERYVGRVDKLAEERKRTDGDREKLMQEYADLQLRLDALTPELAELAGLEDRHGELESERDAVASEIDRLHTINGSLGVLLLGDDGPPPMGGEDGGAAAVAEAFTRLLHLQRRLSDREASHAEEKQRLSDRIRSLERDAATSTMQQEPQAPPPAATAPSRGGAAQGAKKSSSVPVPLAQASSVLKGGFKSLREAAGV